MPQIIYPSFVSFSRGTVIFNNHVLTALFLLVCVCLFPNMLSFCHGGTFVEAVRHFTPGERNAMLATSFISASMGTSSSRAALRKMKESKYWSRTTLAGLPIAVSERIPLFLSRDEEMDNREDVPSNDPNFTDKYSPSQSSSFGKNGPLLQSLLGMTTSRAFRTLSANEFNGLKESQMTPDNTTNSGKAVVYDLLEDSVEDSVEDLIKASIARSSSILSNDNEIQMKRATHRPTSQNSNSRTKMDTILEATIVRSSSILATNDIEETVGQSPTRAVSTSGSSKTTSQTTKTGLGDGSSPLHNNHQDKRTYLQNPGVTPTALAHSLWKSSVLPGVDTVIDATCGNGKDALVLAKMLFPDDFRMDATTEEEDQHGNSSAAYTADDYPKPQLICLDIQSRAIHNTKNSLLSSLRPEIYHHDVTVLQQSHEFLLRGPTYEAIKDGRSVGLVCYNLGYLPGAPPNGTTMPTATLTGDSVFSHNGSTHYKQCQTQTSTTLHSITDAALLLRVGGLLSVMTYPGSNHEESVAVEHFVEGLAMLTTRDEGGWRKYLDNIPDYVYEEDENDNRNEGNEADSSNRGEIRELVTKALEMVVDRGSPNQTWRAFVHKPLGRPLSPVLVTAMRIK